MIYVKECVIEGQKIENSFQIYNEHKVRRREQGLCYIHCVDKVAQVYLVFTETAEEKKMWFEVGRITLGCAYLCVILGTIQSREKERNSNQTTHYSGVFWA